MNGGGRGVNVDIMATVLFCRALSYNGISALVP